MSLWLKQPDHSTLVNLTRKNFGIMIDSETDSNKIKLPKNGLVWFTDRPNTGEGTGAGIHDQGNTWAKH